MILSSKWTNLREIHDSFTKSFYNYKTMWYNDSREKDMSQHLHAKAENGDEYEGVSTVPPCLRSRQNVPAWDMRRRRTNPYCPRCTAFLGGAGNQRDARCRRCLFLRLSAALCVLPECRN